MYVAFFQAGFVSLRNGAVSSPGVKFLGAVSQGSVDSPRPREPGRWPNREAEAKESLKLKKPGRMLMGQNPSDEHPKEGGERWQDLGHQGKCINQQGA